MFYEIKKKGTNIVPDIAKLIKLQFANKSGIIYCLKKNETEKMATELKYNHGIE